MERHHPGDKNRILEWNPEILVLLISHIRRGNEYGYVRMPDHMFGHGAGKYPIYPGTGMRTHDDKVCLPFSSYIQDLLIGDAFGDEAKDLSSPVEHFDVLFDGLVRFLPEGVFAFFGCYPYVCVDDFLVFIDDIEDADSCIEAMRQFKSASCGFHAFRVVIDCNKNPGEWHMQRFLLAYGKESGYGGEYAEARAAKGIQKEIE